MLDDKEKADGVEEEKRELDGGTATEICGDPGAWGLGGALPPIRDNQSLTQHLLSALKELLQ